MLLVPCRAPELTLVVASNEPVVIPVENLALPFTSRVYDGFDVPTPTLPAVVKMLPIVLLLPFAVNKFVTMIVLVDMFVFDKFVEVIFTAFNVPPTTALPDKFSNPAVIVVADMILLPMEVAIKEATLAFVTVN